MTVETQTANDTLYCANHPNTETLLRCNRCNKPICMKCAEQTAVGYRCKECIRGVQDKYFNAETKDYPIAFAVSMTVTAIAAPIAGSLIGRFGFFGFLIAFFIGSSAGGVLAQIIRKAVGKRRGRYLRHFALGGIIAGLLLGAIILTIVSPFGLFALLNLPMLLFTVIAAVAMYQLLR